MDDRSRLVRPFCEALEPRLLLDGGIGDLRIDADTVVWSAFDGHDYEVYAYDNQGVRRLTDNLTDDTEPQIDGGHIVWQGFDGADTEIFYNDGSLTRQLTDNTRDDHSPQIDGDHVVWLADDGHDDEVVQYSISGDTILQVTSTSHDAKYLRIAGSNVTWYSHDGFDFEIYLYDGATIRRVSSNTVSDKTPHVSATHVVWRSDDGNDDEIYLYDIAADATTQVTDNDYNDAYPGLTDSHVIWAGAVDGDYEVFSYDIVSGDTTQLTDNDGDDWSPRVDPEGAVWVDGDSGQIWRYDSTTGYPWQVTNDAQAHNQAAASGDVVIWVRDDDVIVQLDTRSGEGAVQFSHAAPVNEPLVLIADAAAPEGNGPAPMEFTVRLSAPTDHPVTVSYTTADGTAKAGDDYQAATGTITFAPGDVARSVLIPIIGELDIEPDETFTLTLSNVAGGIISGGGATGTLIDDDTPDISVADATVIEGDAAGELAFVIRLSRPIASPVTISYATTDGTAVAADGDYTTTGATLTFNPGDPVARTIVVPVSDDLTVEPHETITFTLSAAINAHITRGEAVGTIRNDDAEIAFDDDALLLSIDEGAEGAATSFDFTVTLAHPSAVAVTVDYATADDIGADADDYDAASGTVTFAPGDTEATLHITVHGDDDIEPDETFAVVLSNATNAMIATQRALGEIFDDDAPRLSVTDVSVLEGAPEIAIYDVAYVEGDEGTIDYVFAVSLSQALSEHVSMAVEVVSGSATLGEDIGEPIAATVVFAAGDTNATVTIPVYGDTDVEPVEYFSVRLTDLVGPAVFADAEATGRIVNDDIIAASPTLTAFDASVPEGDAGEAAVPIVIRLSAPVATDITFDYEVIDGSAVDGTDYDRPDAGTLTIPANTTDITLLVPIITDEDVETNRTFTVRLTNPTGGIRIGDAVARGTIIDDDAAAAYLQFTIALDKPSETSDVTVQYTTAIDDGTATEAVDDEDDGDSEPPPLIPAAADVDYATTSGLLTFSFDGDDDPLTQTVRVPIIGELIPEDTETLQLVLSGAAEAKIIDAKGVGTITNDDTFISFDPDSLTAEIAEGDSGSTLLTFDVVLSHLTASTPTVKYVTAHGSTDDDDYATVTSPATTVSFAPETDDDDKVIEGGVYRGTISISITGDADIEPDDTFTVTLVDPAGGTLGAEIVATGTILDDDTPVAMITDVSVVEGDDGNTDLLFTVTLSRVNDLQPVTIRYATGDDTATSGEDYLPIPAGSTLTFDVNETTETFTVSIRGDRDVEPNETFTVTLSDPIGATLAEGDESAVGTIANDDTGISIADLQWIEGTSLQPMRALVEVSLTEPTSEPVTVEYMTADGTATMLDNDYTPAGGTVTFAPGEQTRTVEIFITSDSRVEPDETFTVILFGESGAVLTENNVATITITDDDIPRLSVSDATVIEGQSPAIRFVVRLVGGIDTGDITVDYTTIEDTAEAGDDYQTTSGTLTFTPDDRTHAIDVPIFDDGDSEPDERLTLLLSHATNATIDADHGQAAGTIRNDDAELTITDAHVEEGHDGPTDLSFTVGLTHASALAVTADVATADNTATAGQDYHAAMTTLTFPAGTTSQTFTVTIVGDLLVETSETFGVDLSNAAGATIVTGHATGTIINDDATPSIEAIDVAVPEGDAGSTMVEIPVRLSNPSALPVSVQYVINEGAATTGTVSFASGETEQVIQMLVAGDTIVEPDEVFEVVLSGAIHATLPDDRATITIQNDDTIVTVSDPSILEGDGGQSHLTFDISLSIATVFEVSVVYTTVDSSAAAGEDYYTAASTLVFTPGQTSQSITVPVLGDTTTEPDEMLLMELTGAVNAVVGGDSGIGTIRNDDGDPAISIADAALSEADAGGQLLELTLSLSHASAYAITVGYETTDGSAAAGSDYIAASGVITFDPLTLTQTLSLRILDDAVIETDETIWVSLSNPTDASIDDGYAAATILDDDAPATLPVIAVANVQLAEGDAGVSVMAFVVTLDGPSVNAVTVDYATVDDTATAGTDYGATLGTLTFEPGETEAIVEVQLFGDTLTEPDETFTLMLSDPTGATIGAPAAVGTIANDELPAPQPQLTASLGTVTLGAWTVPGDKGKVPVVITNTGTAKALGKVFVRTYASTDLALDASDVLLGESKPRRMALLPGRSKTVTQMSTVSAQTPVGQTWYILGEVVVVSGVGGDVAADNVASDPTPRTTEWRFGALAGRKRPVKITVADAAGNPLALSLAGGGWGEVVGGSAAGGIVLHDTTMKSAMGATSGKGRRAEVAGIAAAGPMKAVTGKALDVTGMIDLGFVGALTLGHVTGATLSLGAATIAAKPTTVKLGSATDVTLQSQWPLKSIAAIQWLDTDDTTDSIVAPSLGGLSITGIRKTETKGDFHADLHLGAALGKAAVGGDVTGHWSATTSGKILIKGDLAGATIDLTEALTGRQSTLAGLTVNGAAVGSTVRAAGTIGALKLRAADGSDFLAGVAPVVDRHPTTLGDYAEPTAAIRSIKITGVAKSTNRFIRDTNFAAGSLGVVNLLNADFAGSEIGLWARADAATPVKKVTYTDRLTGEKWTWPPRRNVLFAGPDALINILS